MSCIVYLTNKKTNTKYAYRSESYRDPVTKKPKSRRTYLGRVDPVTNEIIPKAAEGKRNRTPVGMHPVKDAESQANAAEHIQAVEFRRQVEILLDKQARLKKEVSEMDELIVNLYSLVHGNAL